ncbi:hypothetical protein [Desulfitobacterium sp.]|uniref:hypothetical protein n=1 Tax=Desulfitobacterium sp. TaxID=49981 RepID=UPI002B80764D|nr:hypothetical protein [Desulfitobacterium sp.]HVJ50693.1 hypothetical protein [Desulfitobacterium sp.]
MSQTSAILSTGDYREGELEGDDTGRVKCRGCQGWRKHATSPQLASAVMPLAWSASVRSSVCNVTLLARNLK